MTDGAKVLQKIKAFVKTKKEKHIALFVDGPNLLRKDLKVDLSKVKERLEKYGQVKVARVFLDQYASDKLIEAVTNQGFEVVIVPSDVDVALAVDAARFIYHERMDIIAIASRDSDFKPLLTKAKETGKETIVIGCDPDFSVALQNTADVVLKLNE
ncbi:TIGR00288 family protein [Candidatus Micrarchaeota archaeon CG_4_10_14_0_2_um_filter_55_9]|nr:MAG: TIGR00288 family protein [Candidatus Micrarchaeota archaeon CG1_02_55_41]PIO03204.1 MAG: TIGR00288 family protein [Candidatus Micrarchaeota archaeon CG09_land_8_20_14_0_10_55_25]PIZ91618.1 MAG: TIGR00288 family protein [Candidatus Micrarchaeota archaeon CG_4_10_14_0_2_um_filter_55_9]PJD01157.1 MAG: TIGR00288 family protein [Candidatus Micrarchaeota archaeon CG10_big_fil_rev_8_21_14_0_10_54_18]